MLDFAERDLERLFDEHDVDARWRVRIKREHISRIEERDQCKCACASLSDKMWEMMTCRNVLGALGGMVALGILIWQLVSGLQHNQEKLDLMQAPPPETLSHPNSA